METRANYALIGTFSLAVILSAFGFVYWFASASSSVARTTYEIVFTGSVSGLSQGSSVLFNGLKIGDVREINLMPNDPKSVVARISIDARTPIRSDTTARLEYQGLTGSAQIALTGGDSEAQPVSFIPGHDYQVIHAEKSDLQDIVETLRAVARKADDVLGSVEQVVTDNKENVSNTVKNIEKFSEALGENSEGVDRFLEQISAAAEKVGPLAERLDTLAADVNRIVVAIDEQKIRKIVDNVESFTGKLNETANHFDGLIASVENFLGSSTGEEGASAFAELKEASRSFRQLADNLNAKVNLISPGLTQFSGPGLREFQALAAEARQAVAEINRAARSIERNPQQFIFGNRPSMPAYNGRR